jgi:hypothetical protein
MGKIADRVREMRGCSLAAIVAEIERMEAGAEPDLLGDLDLFIGAPPFETWWAQWPDKVAKKAAEKAWRAARGRGWSVADLLRFAAEYIAGKDPARPWMHAATFLNGERWKDAAASVKPTNAVAARRVALRERLSDEHGLGRERGGAAGNARQISGPVDR